MQSHLRESSSGVHPCFRCSRSAARHLAHLAQLTVAEHRGPATVRRGSESQDGVLSPEQQHTVHEWELKHGVVPLDDAHPHPAVEERLMGAGGQDEKRGPVAPRRGSMAESAPLSPTQVATMHEWELKHGIVTLEETRVTMEVD